MQDVHEGAARPVRGTYSLIAWLCALVGLAAAAWPIAATAGAFLNLTGIPGESTAEGHKDEVVVLSYDLSLVVPPSTDNRPSSRLICPPVAVLKNLDLASAVLAKKLLQGIFVQRAVLTLQREGANPLDYFLLTMDEVFINEFSQVTSADPSRVVEKVVFTAQRYGLEYRLQTNTGGQSIVKAGWDCKTGTVF
jgi:type VI secretion system secreted protein Hcp